MVYMLPVESGYTGVTFAVGEELRSERRKPPGRHTKIIFRTEKITPVPMKNCRN